MMNEEKLLHEIIAHYDEQLTDIDFKTTIPRNTLISEFSPQQSQLLKLLIERKKSLFLEFEYFDTELNDIIYFEDDAKELELFHQPQKYQILSIDFDYAFSLITISLIFQDQIEQLLKEVLIPEPFDKKIIAVALLVAVICFLTFFITYNDIHELLAFIIFAIGFLALGYIYDKIKNSFINKSKKKINERKFYASQYLSAHLARHAIQKLNLDQDIEEDKT